MPAGFEAYDDAGNLQFSSEAAAYYIHSATSVAITNVSNSYGRVIVALTHASDLVAFRSATAFNMSGFRGPNDYTIYTQALSGTIEILILRSFRQLSPSADNFGLQVFGADGGLLYSAARKAVFVFGSVSVYGEDLAGDVNDQVITGANTNPYALILGNELIAYTGAAEFDAYERILNVGQTASDRVTVGNANRNDWPGMPGNGGVEIAGNYTVAAVY